MPEAQLIFPPKPSIPFSPYTLLDQVSQEPSPHSRGNMERLHLKLDKPNHNTRVTFLLRQYREMYVCMMLQLYSHLCVTEHSAHVLELLVRAAIFFPSRFSNFFPKQPWDKRPVWTWNWNLYVSCIFFWHFRRPLRREGRGIRLGSLTSRASTCFRVFVQLNYWSSLQSSSDSHEESALKRWKEGFT